jgi:hypothetical protein
MFIHVVNSVSGRRARLEAQTLSKVLHLAAFHGWRPERIGTPPPVASWDTQIIMPYMTPYLSGTVSDTDAASLVASLKRVVTSEGAGLASEVYLALLGLIAVGASGQFEVHAEFTPDDEMSPLSRRL